ncbi:MAG TPA: hypothetical protein VMU04_05100 [Candidatus Acidoferrum sp.]|nr:hypothetical protein [Candidatus Acidoferrum sp.]
MRTKLFRSILVLTALCTSLAIGQRVFAGPAASRDLLVQAYTALEQADHDYKGHRVEAMKHVEAAAKLLGVSVRGEGKGHEKQGMSDEQLRSAQSLLQEARGGLKGKPLKQVNKALQQISVALSIK